MLWLAQRPRTSLVSAITLHKANPKINKATQQVPGLTPKGKSCTAVCDVQPCTPIPAPAWQFVLQSYYPTKLSYRVTFYLTEFSVFALLVVFAKSERGASISQEWQRDTFRRMSWEQASHAQDSWRWHLSSITCKAGTEEPEAPSDSGDRQHRVLRTDIWDLGT